MDIKKEKEILQRNIKEEAEPEPYQNSDSQAPHSSLLDVKFEDSSEICGVISVVQNDDVEILSGNLDGQHVCRLCAKVITTNKVFLFGEVNYTEQINFAFPIRVANGDGLPEYICLDCEGNLNAFYNFVLKVIDADIEIKSKFTSDVKNLPSDHFLEEPEVPEKMQIQEEIAEVCPKVENKEFFKKEKKCIVRRQLTFECDKCEKLFSTHETLQKHLQSKHFSLVCEICGMQFMSESFFNVHKVQHLQAEQYQCVICHKNFDIRHKLLRHTRQCHSGTFNILLK